MFLLKPHRGRHWLESLRINFQRSRRGAGGDVGVDVDGNRDDAAIAMSRVVARVGSRHIGTPPPFGFDWFATGRLKFFPEVANGIRQMRTRTILIDHFIARISSKSLPFLDLNSWQLVTAGHSRWCLNLLHHLLYRPNFLRVLGARV